MPCPAIDERRMPNDHDPFFCSTFLFQLQASGSIAIYEPTVRPIVREHRSTSYVTHFARMRCLRGRTGSYESFYWY